MRDIWEELKQWEGGGEPFALARVVATWGSAPRAVGSAMLVGADRRVTGSVSGGCIEGAVIEEAARVLETGSPKQLTYGVDDETAWSVGLSCGGQVSVLVERHLAFSDDAGTQSAWEALRTRIAESEPAVLLTRLRSPSTVAEPYDSPHLLVSLDGAVAGDWGAANELAIVAAHRAYEARLSEVVQIEGEDVFVQVFPRRDQLIIIGAGHITIPLVQFAHQLELDTVVIDPRDVFARQERFPVPPTKLLAAWPRDVLRDSKLDEETYAVLLTHDPKIDDQALHFFLKAPVAYIGALGGRNSHAKRCERLRGAGFDEDAISRIKGPVGLDIGADTPAEIALSIAAEVVAVKARALEQARQG